MRYGKKRRQEFCFNQPSNLIIILYIYIIPQSLQNAFTHCIIYPFIHSIMELEDGVLDLMVREKTNTQKSERNVYKL